MNELTQQYLHKLFNYRNGNLYYKIHRGGNAKIGDKAGTLYNNGYYSIRINKKLYLNHRLIFLYHYNYLPQYIDHIDGNKSNNNINNLRKITISQNAMNKKPNKNCLSIYKGVSWNKRDQKWYSRIQINSKYIYLGSFKLETDAAIAYNEAAIKYYSEYANLNNIKE